MEIQSNSEEQKVEEKVEQQEEEQKIKRKKKKLDERSLGLGIDIGTAFLVSAQSIGEKANFKVQRDAFFDVENNLASKKMLAKLDANHIISEDKKRLFVIGEEALQMANFFSSEVRRPLSKGVISTREKEALSMIKIILHALLGSPIKEKEPCYFSVPAKPIDQDDYNVVYHQNILKSFVTSFGFKAVPLNEAYAIVWGEMEDTNYTGMAISLGAGMVNCALSFMGISEDDYQFSIARSGDWIDINAAAAVGLKASRITTIKEAGVDLLNPKGREHEAIKIYYENLIEYVCKGIEKKLSMSENLPNFEEPITIVVSGGTSKIGNFDKVFEKEIRTKTLPFEIKEVRKAKDPLNAVAKGCLLNALQHEEE